MKKFLALMTAALVTASMAVAAFAADAPNGYIKMNVTDAELIDDDTTQDKGGSGQPIQYVDGFGIGYSSLNDAVAFTADFGANGADALNILFSYGNNDGSKTTLAFYVDDLKSTPVATAEIGYTGGWNIDGATWVNVPMNVPAGTHTVYVQFTGTLSGSFSEVVFEEAEAAAAPATFDAGVICAVAALVSGAGVVVARKKH